jgi:hypothetical protein
MTNSLPTRVNAERDVLNGYGDRIVIETLRVGMDLNETWAVWNEADVGPFKNIYQAKRTVADRLGCHITEVRVVQ